MAEQTQNTTEEQTQDSESNVSAGVSITAEYARKYSFDASGATRVTARIVPLPPPTLLLQRLGVAQAFIDDAKSRIPPPDGGQPAPPADIEDELNDHQKEWAEFGARWLEAAEPVIVQVEELREVYVAKADPPSKKVATMLAQLARVLKWFPDSAESVEKMKTFLNEDQAVLAADANTDGVAVEIQASMLPVLDYAPI